MSTQTNTKAMLAFYGTYNTGNKPIVKNVRLYIPPDATYTDEQQVKNLTAINNDTVTLFAQWTPNKYNIQYNGNGATSGSTAAQNNITYDTYVTLNQNGFKREYTVTYSTPEGASNFDADTVAYSFSGWKNNNAGSLIANGASVKNLATSGTATLWAQWNSNSVSLPTPSKPGYTFTGWYKDQEMTQKADNNYTPTANITLYAKLEDKTAPTKPVIRLEYEDHTPYTSGTWTNRKVFSVVTTTEEGSGVKNFEWSNNNGTNWNQETSFTKDGTTYTRRGSWNVSNNRVVTTVYRVVDNDNNTSEVSDPVTIKYDIQKPTNLSVTNSSNGNWTKNNIVITLNGTDNESGIARWEWYENGAWTTRALTTTNGVGTITYTAERNAEIRFRAIDGAGNISDEITTWVKIDKTAPTIVSATPSNTLDIENYVDFNATDAYGITAYNITDSTTAPTTWIPVVDDVETTTETKYELNAAWARVFHHNNHWGAIYYASADEAKDVQEIDKYSVLDNLESYRNTAGKYEFLLQYPDLSSTGYNRWKQTDNPATTQGVNNTTELNGYEPIQLSWETNFWAGLALSSASTSTLIDGSPKASTWYYAIGARDRYYSAIPGPKAAVSTVNLWTRIDEMTSSSSTNLTRRIGDLKENKDYYVWVKDASGNTTYRKVTVSNVDITVPATATITSTNNVATTQSVTLTMGDNKGVTRYYFGKTNPASNSTFTWTSITSTESTSINATVNSDGVWYLGVQDAAGNRKIANKTFYKTTLTPNKGSVSPASVLTASGESFTLPTPSAVNGYTWGGWYTDSACTTAVTLTNGKYAPTATATLYGKWTPTPYTITYNLNNGSLPSGKTNPTTYNIESAAITLNNPTRTGYNFSGWTGSNGTTAQTTVTIPTGSTGNKTYTANWTAKPYTLTVKHYLENANDNKYTLADTTTHQVAYDTNMTLADYAKTITNGTYDYASLTDSVNGGASAKITTHKMGEGATVCLYYLRNKYNLSLTKGDYIKGVTGAGSYKVGQSVTINATLADNATGYTNSWVNWTSSDTSLVANTNTQNATITMPASAITLTAHGTRTPITYTITYNLNGGVQTNPKTTYNIEDNNFTLVNPTKTGYTFAGWTGSNGTTAQTTVTITKGSTGNKTYTATWTANSYTVTADAAGGTIPTTTNWTNASGNGSATKSVTYDGTYGNLPTPTKTGYTFAGWKLLPDGYEQVEYIESNATQYLDTGTKFNSNTDKFEIDYQVNNENGNYFIAGSGWNQTGKIWVYSYKSRK